MEYIGRDKEIRLLAGQRETGRSSLVVIFGRRRVGKSSLVQKAFAKQKIFDFEGLENENDSKQLEHFQHQLCEHFSDASVSANSWYELLSSLSSLLPEEPSVLFLDELQWIANYRDEFVGIFKTIWDKYLSKKQNLTVVLCGSVASFMVNKVVKSSALYGRSDLTIHLRPLKLKETKLFLKDLSPTEILIAQMIVGGIPGYLQLLQRKSSVYLGIQELAFESHGYLTTEYDRIFTSQFGKSKGYENIVGKLSGFPNGLSRQEIAKTDGFSDGGSLSHLLEDLELAGFISTYVNFNSAPRFKKYRLSDPFLRFYFKFIKQYLADIEMGRPNIFIRLFEAADFYSWMGLATETMCYEHRYELSKLMGFSDVEYKVGPYAAKNSKGKGTQADLVYDRNDNVITLCEIKYQQRPITPQIIDEVQKKVEFLPNPRGKTIQKALIVRRSPPKGLVGRGYFSHIINIEQLMSVQ